MSAINRVLVVGATGGSGRATVNALLEKGHRVTAFARHADALAGRSDRLETINGDAMNPDDVDRAVKGHDAVVVTLGISENPIRVRLFGAKGTANRVRSEGTRNVIAAMKKHGVRRLVVQSSYGVGETKDRPRGLDRLFLALLLKPQIADTEAQEVAVREGDVDWVLVQPVHLADDEETEMPFASADGDVREMKVSRRRVGRFLAEAVGASAWVGRSVALSG